MATIDRKKSFKIRGKLINIEFPAVMGILNITPDSFYEGSRNMLNMDAIGKAEEMCMQGARILDVGAVSTRPGAKIPDEKLELQRLLSVVPALRKAFPNVLISIDTFRSKVASIMYDEGVDMINDVSAAAWDDLMVETMAEIQLPYIMMHTLDKPDVMQQNPHYNDVVVDINKFFAERITRIRSAGVHDIIIDPGFGFGKTLEHNYRLLNQLQTFTFHEVPLLVGLSRKSMIYKALETDAAGALAGTVSANTVALLNGADILRVHDVKEAVDAIKIVAQIIK